MTSGIENGRAHSFPPSGGESANPPDCAETAATTLSSLVTLPYSTRRARAFFKSFVYAYFGILQVLATQRNMVVHCIIAIPTLLATQLLAFEPIENVVVLICVALVLACEIVNTSIENLCNVVSPEFRPAVRRSKDAAAAMVLISAIASAAVGVILFTSKQRLEHLMRWQVEWRWGGSVDNVMVKLVFLGICWLFVHAWVYRRHAMREDERRPFKAASAPPPDTPRPQANRQGASYDLPGGVKHP